MSPQSKRKLRVAIIGSGFGVYGLLPAFKKIPSCEVVALCGTHERLDAYCKEQGFTHHYRDWKVMLREVGIDALVIATPPRIQYQIAKVAIKRGIHIFAEKPLADTYIHAKELLALSKKHSVVTAVDFIFPEIPLWQKVKELIDTERYGELVSLEISWDFLSYDLKYTVDSWKTRVRDGGGALAFFASHTLYYLEYFGGKIRTMQGNLSYDKRSLGKGDTQVDVHGSFSSRATFRLHVACDNDKKHEHRLLFVCSKATLELVSKEGVTDNFRLFVRAKGSSKELFIKKKRTTSNRKKNEDERVHVVESLAQRFVEGCLKERGVIPSFVEGVQVQKMIEKIRG